MREHGQRRRAVQPGIDALVNMGDHLRDGLVTLAEPLQDRRFALGAVMREGAQIASRIAHGTAMRQYVDVMLPGGRRRSFSIEAI